MPKSKCLSCQSSRVICWGYNKSGSRRYRCVNCGTSTVVKRKDVARRNRLPWFKYWLGGSTFAAIARPSRRSQKTVKRSIHRFLDHPPKPCPVSNLFCHLIIDATWFKRNHCLLAYWDHDRQRVQWWRYTTGESGFEIAQDLRWLKDEGVICASITSDGGKGLNTAVNLVYPDIPHQRCLVHIRRQGLAWLTRNPKTIPGQQLKPLTQELTKIETWEQAGQWTKAVLDWEQKWNMFLKQRTYFPGTGRWWYTHRSLRKVRALVIHAIPDLFHYLDDPLIPKTSNGLEGRFGSLKMHYRQHRGLTKQRREAYLAWYLTVVVNGEKPTRNVL